MIGERTNEKKKLSDIKLSILSFEKCAKFEKENPSLYEKAKQVVDNGRSILDYAMTYLKNSYPDVKNVNYPLACFKENELKKDLRKQKFTDIETNHPEILNYILKKNCANQTLLLEFKDIRNEKMHTDPKPKKFYDKSVEKLVQDTRSFYEYCLDVHNYFYKTLDLEEVSQLEYEVQNLKL